MNAAWPTATLVHLPSPACCLNQVEVYFSVQQRKAITPTDFADLDALGARILALQDRYNHTARPFDWTFDRTESSQARSTSPRSTARAAAARTAIRICW